MSDIDGGIKLAGKITPTDTEDTYPTHDSAYGKGGHHEVDTITDRDNIPSDRRREGMLVYVKTPTPTRYELSGGITNNDWIEFTSGSEFVGEEFTTVLKDKLDGIEDNATGDMSGTEILTLLEDIESFETFTTTLKSKLDNIEDSATGDLTNIEIATLYEGTLGVNRFTDELKAKLDGLDESGSTLTGAEIATLYEAEDDINRFSDLLKSKLDGIEDGATGDMDADAIVLIYEGYENANRFTDDLKDKLESLNPNSAEFTASLRDKLIALDPEATDDLTASEVADLYENIIGVERFTPELRDKLNALSNNPTVYASSFFARTVIFEFLTSHAEPTASPLGVRNISFYKDATKLNVDIVNDVFLSEHESDPDYSSVRAFDPSLLLTGPAQANSFYTVTDTGAIRVIFQFDSSKEITRIDIDNFHDSGTNTLHGVKDCKVFYSTDVYANLNVDNIIPNGGSVFNGVIPEHSAVDEADTYTLPLAIEYAGQQHFELVEYASSGFCHGWVDENDNMAGGIKDDGTLAFQAMEAEELTAGEATVDKMSLNELNDIVLTPGIAGYAWALADANGNVALGVKTDGSVVVDELSAREIIGYSSSEGGTSEPSYDGVIEQLSNALMEWGPTNGYKYTITDENGNIAFGIKDDGTVVANTLTVENLIEEGSGSDDIIDSLRSSLSEWLEVVGYQYVIGDENGNIALGIRDDGAVVMNELVVNSIINEGSGSDGTILSNLEAALSEWLEVVGYQFVIGDENGNLALGVKDDGTVKVHTLEVDDLVGYNPGGGTVVNDTVGHEHPAYVNEINHILNYGQSLSLGGTSRPSITTWTEHDSLMFNTGVRTKDGTPSSVVDLSENDTGNYHGETPASGTSYAIKSLIFTEDNLEHTDHIYRLLFSADGWGGKSIAELTSDTEGHFTRLQNSIQLGFDTATSWGDVYNVSAITWTQGEQDEWVRSNGEYYTAALEDLRLKIEATAQSITGRNATIPLISYQLDYHKTLEHEHGLSNVPPTIALAQLEAQETFDNIYVATPTYHLDYTPDDDTHLINTSSKILGFHYGIVYKRVVIDGLDWKPLQPISTEIVQNRILIVKFHVPDGKLVFDTTQVSFNTDYGFQIVDSGDSDKGIDSVRILNDDTLKIVCSGNITSGDKLRYAWERNSTANEYAGRNHGPRGNLRDTQGDNIQFSLQGGTYEAHNWCVIFEETI